MFACTDECFDVVHAGSVPVFTQDQSLCDTHVAETEALLQHCKAAGVRRFVYLSDAIVAFDDKRPRCHADEQEVSTASASRIFPAARAHALAENLVAQSSAAKHLETVVLRPHGVFGPGDETFLPLLAQAAGEGKGQYILGDGVNTVDFTCVENVAYAAALALAKLDEPDSNVAGQTYFITNDEPCLFSNFATRLANGLGYEQPVSCVPASLARRLPAAFRPNEELLNDRVISYASSTHFYSCERARRELDYEPLVSLSHGIAATVAEARKQAGMSAPNSSDELRVSKEPVSLPTQLLLGLLLVVLAFLSRTLPAAALLEIAKYSAAAAAVIGAVVWVYPYMIKAPVQYVHGSRLEGVTVVVTGANKGLGFATATSFAQLGARVILACRNPGRAQTAVNQIKASVRGATVEWVPCDLSSFASVRSMVSTLKNREIVVDYLVNNAGCMLAPSTTADGHDAQLQTNYIGPCLLTKLCVDKDVLARDGRVVNVSSLLHYSGHIDFSEFGRDSVPQPKRSVKPQVLESNVVYANTKLAQVLFTQELQHRVFSGTRRTAVSIHPGVIESDFFLHVIPAWVRDAVTKTGFFSIFSITPAQASWAVMRACLAPDYRRVGGVYFDESNAVLPSTEARNSAVARELWALTESLIGGRA